MGRLRGLQRLGCALWCSSHDPFGSEPALLRPGARGHVLQPLTTSHGDRGLRSVAGPHPDRMTLPTLEELLAKRDVLQKKLAPGLEELGKLKREIRRRKAGAASAAVRSRRVATRDLDICAAMSAATSPRDEKLKLARKYNLSRRSIDRVLHDAKVAAAAAAVQERAPAKSASPKRQKRPASAPVHAPAPKARAAQVPDAGQDRPPRRRGLPGKTPSGPQTETNLPTTTNPSTKSAIHKHLLYNNILRCDRLPHDRGRRHSAGSIDQNDPPLDRAQRAACSPSRTAVADLCRGPRRLSWPASALSPKDGNKVQACQSFSKLS